MRKFSFLGVIVVFGLFLAVSAHALTPVLEYPGDEWYFSLTFDDESDALLNEFVDENVDGAASVDIYSGYVYERYEYLPTEYTDPNGEWELEVDIEDTLGGTYSSGTLDMSQAQVFSYTFTDLTDEDATPKTGNAVRDITYEGTFYDEENVSGIVTIPASVPLDVEGFEKEALIEGPGLFDEDVEQTFTATTYDVEEYDSSGVIDEEYDDYSYDDSYYDDYSSSDTMTDDEVLAMVGGIIGMTFLYIGIIFVFALLFMGLPVFLYYLAILIGLILLVKHLQKDKKQPARRKTPAPKA